MDLEQIVKYSPELIIQEQVLSFLLERKTFAELFSVLINPNIFENVEKLEVLWESYYRKHYDITQLSKDVKKVNWFYEVIIQEISSVKEYYYNSKNKDFVLASYIPNFQSLRDIRNTEIHPDYLLKYQINENNKLPFYDIVDVKYGSFQEAYILHTNGDVSYLYKGQPTIIVLNNIKKMIYVDDSSMNHVIFLTRDGKLYVKRKFNVNDFILEKFKKLDMPLIIKDVQSDVGDNFFSIQTYDNNLYSIQMTDSRNINKEKMNFYLTYPFLMNEEILSYSIIHYGDTKNKIISILYYITTDGILRTKSFNNFIEKLDNVINTMNNVLIKEVKIHKKLVPNIIHGRTEYIYKNISSYKDIDDNIYIVDNFMTQFPRKYEIPDEEMDLDRKITQFFIDSSNELHVVFLCNDGKMGIGDYPSSHIQDHIIPIDFSVNINYPPESRIISNNENQIIIEIKRRNEHVVFPYSLYLLHHLQNSIANEIIKGNQIIFRLKNSDYTFVTSIPE